MSNDTIVATVFGTYDLLFNKHADPRVATWIGFGHPFGVIAIISTYLYLVCNCLPNYMKDRKAYNIQRLIQGYNLFQVIICTTIVYQILSNGWSIQDTLQPITYNTTPRNMRMLYFCYYNFTIKIVDLIETLFFVLRNKQNQVTILHLYHHCSTVFLSWLTTQYMGSDFCTFTIVLNSSIHVLMYTYYFLSTLGPSVQQKIQIIKSKLTTIQMIQFCILATHTILFTKYHPRPLHMIIGYLYVVSLVINFSLFLNFYMRSYKKRKTL